MLMVEISGSNICICNICIQKKEIFRASIDFFAFEFNLWFEYAK